MHAFLAYSLTGFVDGLRDQCHRIETVQLALAWEHYVYEQFRARRRSASLDRRREVTLALGRVAAPVRKREVPDLNTEIARRYATKTPKTLTRDLNWLVERGLLVRTNEGYVARTEAMRAFRQGAEAGGMRVADA